VPGEQPAMKSCPECHQTDGIDSLSGRCQRCHSITIEDIAPELQDYARSAHTYRSRKIVISILVGPAILAAYFFELYSGRRNFFLLALGVIVTAALGGIGLRAVLRFRTLILRYYRLGFVMKYVKPIDAELWYSVGNRSPCYFHLERLAPGAVWRGVRQNKIRIDPPYGDCEQLVRSTHTWSNFQKGSNPIESEHFWAKVYFDPDESGSAVITIGKCVFVSAKENYVW
jgi:hypothetical protein